ncbi:hypothetical protein AA15669_0670 [Saccharibacter floricola DSM 15669]|uniref:Uncharacterized protein n=1 Tax=Saccharibacter floricola DSM 15669 TaxID=1123227 RepID=A0ABQ0NXI3_9PROT|nr:hypothetical protein AA15669_0670 [Saccharibacter floricola DSM 15669]
MVVRSNKVGNEVKSSGVSKKRATIKIKTDDVIERESPMSKINVGSGTIRIEMRRITPRARRISVPGKVDRTAASPFPPGWKRALGLEKAWTA